MNAPSPRPPPPPPPPSTRSRRKESYPSEDTLPIGESLHEDFTVQRRSSGTTNSNSRPRDSDTHNNNEEHNDGIIQNPNPIQQNLQLDHHRTEESSAMLKVRTFSGDFLQILITPEMEPEELALCITHAILSPEDESKWISRWRSNDEALGNLIDGFQIAGLFRERDGVFVPLQVILQDLNIAAQDTFRISRRPYRINVQKEKKHSSFTPSFIREMIIYATFALYFAFRVATGEGLGAWFERGIVKLMNIPFFMVETFVDYPLRELYRYGPSIVGWEGLGLPLICSQVTHMGDEQFWTRNIDECQKIYETKELASLHFRRPIVVLILAYLLFLSIRSLVRTVAIRDQNRPTHDMVETYKAFQMILRVFHRGLNRLEDDRHMKGRRITHK